VHVDRRSCTWNPERTLAAQSRLCDHAASNPEASMLFLEQIRNLNYKIVATSIFAFAFLTALAVLCWFVSEPTAESRGVSFGVLILAIAIGWLLGIAVSPYNPGEKRLFTDAAKAASVFVSGYLLAKFDGLIEKALGPEMLADPVGTYRVVMFVAAALFSLILTFVHRNYVAVANRPQQAPEASPP
jgi:hypothetical protein